MTVHGSFPRLPRVSSYLHPKHPSQGGVVEATGNKAYVQANTKKALMKPRSWQHMGYDDDFFFMVTTTLLLEWPNKLVGTNILANILSY